MTVKPQNGFVFGKRSRDSLNGVNKQLVTLAELALSVSDVDFTVIEGLRTAERQAQLLREKKTKVAHSKHQDGLAIDVMPVGAEWNKPEQWLPVLDAFYRAGKLLNIPIRFGYTWTKSPHDAPAKFLDAPHIELR